jgi:hypothetical protein
MQARSIGTYRVTIEGRDPLGYRVHVKATTHAPSGRAAIVQVEQESTSLFNIAQVTKAQARRMS